MEKLLTDKKIKEMLLKAANTRCLPPTSSFNLLNLYFHAVKNLTYVESKETLVVEDALHCVQTAVSAGFLTAGVYDAASLPEEWQEMQKICTVWGESLSEILKKLQ